ncbi:MAG: hypothetical protein WDW36_000723 [Sanguina aurantia]
MDACWAGDVARVKQLSVDRHKHVRGSDEEAAEAAAILTGNVSVFQILVSCYAASRQGRSSEPYSGGDHLFYTSCDAPSANYDPRSEYQDPTDYGYDARQDAVFKYIIVHQRDPLPFITSYLESGGSHESAFECLINASKWAAARTFVESVPETHPFSHLGWEALGSNYLFAGVWSSADWSLRAWQAGGPSPVWEAAIDCARRSRLTRSGQINRNNLWAHIFTYCFAEGATEAALDIAEEAAHRISGQEELRLLREEHGRAGREVKARQCASYAKELLSPGRWG